MSVITESDVRDFVETNEDNIAWMYGDGRRFVTVGIGHLVEDVDEAQALNLVNKHTGAPATHDEIAGDFEAAATGISDHAADYEEGALLRLADGEVGRLFSADFTDHLAVAKDFFPMDGLPQNVQIALFDLAFQVGEARGEAPHFGGLCEEQYPRLHDALSRSEWAQAGVQMEVNKPIVTAKRNAARSDKAKEARTA